MKRQKLYLETSVWNFLLTDDSPDKKKDTETFFKEVDAGKFDIFISGVVNLEFGRAPARKQRALQALIERYDPVFLEEEIEIVELAEAYIRNGVLSRKHINDLLHLAYASASAMNALVSWNLSHLVKMRTQDLGNATNLSLGYSIVQIRTPREVTEIEDE